MTTVSIPAGSENYPASKIHVSQLRTEVATALGVSPSEVGVSRIGTGTRTFNEGGKVRQEVQQPAIIITIPDGANIETTQVATKNHNPTLTDAEEGVNERLASASDVILG